MNSRNIYKCNIIVLQSFIIIITTTTIIIIIIIIIIIVIFLTAIGLSPGGNGYYACT